MLNALELIAYQKNGIVSKRLAKTGKLDVTLFCMAAGTEISEHTSTREAIVFVLEGKGTFNLKGGGLAMKAGALITMEKNSVHSLKAEENTSFILCLCG